MPIEVCTFPFLLIVVEQSICNFRDGEEGGAGGEEGAMVWREGVEGEEGRQGEGSGNSREGECWGSAGW